MTSPKPPRHEWYQTDTHVVITVFTKNAPADTQVQFTNSSVHVHPSFEMALAHPIQPALSTYKILSTKIEISALKLIANEKWDTLEQQQPAPPAKGKNWDSVTNELLVSNDEPNEGDAALMKLFQDIYSKADPNTKRAMMKSYVESNGTTLSTSWDEVGGKPVETKPPQGMVAKPYLQ